MKYFSILLFAFINLSSYGQCTTCSHCIGINEFALDPKDGANGNSSSTGEFIELYNECDEDVDIGCFTICLSDATSGGRGDCITIPAGTVLGSGEVYLIGGYGTNCTGGETDCDWDGLALDYNWHSNATEVWDIKNDQFFTSNTGGYIGVLLDGGEEISLHSCSGEFLEGVKYSNGSGSYTTTENIQSVNGCNAKSITIDSDDIVNLGNSASGSSADEGWKKECDNSWLFTPYSDQTPGESDFCSLAECISAMAYTEPHKHISNYKQPIRIQEIIYYNILGQPVNDSINASYILVKEVNGKTYIQKR